jgi:hypothetical protein
MMPSFTNFYFKSTRILPLMFSRAAAPTVAVCCIARVIPVSLEVSAVLGMRRMSTG